MNSEIILHGDVWKLDDVSDQIAWCLTQKWHREIWEPTAALIHKQGRTSRQFTGQKFDSDKIDFVQNGWKHDHCEICWWPLHTSDDPDHAEGYKNESNAWLCSECFAKIIHPQIHSEQDDGANRPQLGFAGEFKLGSITPMPEP